jgi:hypothetical protein
VGAVLTTVYALTLAPGVTLWDAGEFLAAIHSLGIPHPPGTPLYVALGAVWGQSVGALVGFARGSNLLSALATAVGCAILATCVVRWTSSRSTGVAAGLTAGSVLSVWRSATETEVYALSLALAFVALALADRAGRSGRLRDALLALYVLALAVPLHLSALVIAPGVVLLAATDISGRVERARLLALSGAALLAMALGTVQPWLALVGVLVMFAPALTQGDRSRHVRAASALAAVVLLAVSGVALMYFRARFDPFVNQGNPASLEGLLGVIGREQYDVPPLWPRRAPFWLQLGNLVQYADWQVAFGLDAWVGPSVRRTPFTVLFAALAAAGALWHRALDRRSFRAYLVALASASLGSVLVLNLRAGPSIGIGVLPAGAPHEARERDYFFAMAFALAAVWAAMGAARFGAWLGRRSQRRLAAPATLALAGLPILCNWRAADRSDGGTATLAEHFGAALLEAAPPNAVLFVAGDNDTYPLWYLQQVHGRRSDVTVVTIPLLPARWYREELARRHALLEDDSIRSWRGLDATLAGVAATAQRKGRPRALAVSLPAAQRQALGDAWVMRGLVYVRDRGESHAAHVVPVRFAGDTLLTVAHDSGRVFVDTVATRRIDESRGAAPSDPTESYIAALLRCPGSVYAAVHAGRGSVDPRCNLR